jgi:ABC-type branched-subunit amino acid transport system substrate-binding protein
MTDPLCLTEETQMTARRHAPHLRSSRSTRMIVLVAAATLGVVTVGCGRSSSDKAATGNTSTGAPVVAASSSAAAGKGDFGDLKAICGPGSAKGPVSRGVTATQIRIGVLADPGSEAAPGLEQEFFDAGAAFSQWCNAAGGINGRKIVIDKLDAKLFNVGQQMVDACQKDFMLVGGGNALDEPGVKPRLACKLGSIPGYDVSEAATNAGLQVKAAPSDVTQYGYGPLRLLLEAYPQAKAAMGVGSSNLASLIPIGKRVAEALKANGGTVTAVQEKPPLIDNYRPYMEQLKSLKTLGLYEFEGQSIAPEIQAMKNISWAPQFIQFTSQFYTPQTVAAAKSLGTYPPSYVGLSHLPFELSDDFPVLAEIKSQLKAAVSSPRFTEYTTEAYSAWTLWAQSATACGSDLTVNCVLEKAGAHTDWTAGGLTPPVSTSPSNTTANECWLVIKLEATGWVYDKKVTQPNKGVYNCDPKNVVKVQSFT